MKCHSRNLWPHFNVMVCFTHFFKGPISTEKVDYFNLPLYYVSIGEMERLVEKNGCFAIERMEPMSQPINTLAGVQTIVSHLRAAMEGLIKEHFENDILEDLFMCFAAKLIENYFIHDAQYRKNIYLFLLLKHKGKPGSFLQRASQQSKKGKADVEPTTKSSEAGHTIIIFKALAKFFRVGPREILQSQVLRHIFKHIKVNYLESYHVSINARAPLVITDAMQCQLLDWIEGDSMFA